MSNDLLNSFFKCGTQRLMASEPFFLTNSMSVHVWTWTHACKGPVAHNNRDKESQEDLKREKGSNQLSFKMAG